ncbi:hypothetical protein VTI28DRAFT_8791 [Corynascus sepedonium]
MYIRCPRRADSRLWKLARQTPSLFLNQAINTARELLSSSLYTVTDLSCRQDVQGRGRVPLRWHTPVSRTKVIKWKCPTYSTNYARHGMKCPKEKLKNLGCICDYYPDGHCTSIPDPRRYRIGLGQPPANIYYKRCDGKYRNCNMQVLH